MSKQPPKPYFDDGTHVDPLPSAAPNVLFIDFLSRLEGPAYVQIDAHQELIVMLLRNRCLPYCLSEESDVIVRTLNQLCAIYHEGSVQSGNTKSFEVFHAFHQEYVRVQEQMFYLKQQAKVADEREVRHTTNLIVHAHDLLEGNIRRLAALGVFSVDVLEHRKRAIDLSPQQYVDLGLTEKLETFSRTPLVSTATHDVLFGAVKADIRNAIAHRRFEVEEDGSAILFDFRPQKNQRVQIGRLSQSDILEIVRHLQMAVDVFEISVLIYQHNHGAILHQLGFYEAPKAYTDKQLVEMLHLEGPPAFVRVKDVSIENTVVTARIEFLGSRDEESVIHVNSSDASGNPRRYSVPIRPVPLNPCHQAFRFMQKAAQYAGNYKEVRVIMNDNRDSEIGRATASIELLGKSLPLEQFLAELTENTFPSC